MERGGNWLWVRQVHRSGSHPALATVMKGPPGPLYLRHVPYGEKVGLPWAVSSGPVGMWAACPAQSRPVGGAQHTAAEESSPWFS